MQQEDEKPEIDKEKDVYVVVPEDMAKKHAEHLRSILERVLAEKPSEEPE